MTCHINQSTRQLQNVNKCLQISKHALIAPTFKSPPWGSVCYTLHALCVGAGAHVQPLLWSRGCTCCAHTRAAASPAQGSVPHGPRCTLRSSLPPMSPHALGHGLCAAGDAVGWCWQCPNKVPPPPPAPSHLPGVSLSFPGYWLIRIAWLLLPVSGTRSQVVLDVPKSHLNGGAVGHTSWGWAPGFPWLLVPVWAGQAHSRHCPCFWELKVHQLILLAFLACCLFWEGASFLAGVPSRRFPCLLLVQSRVLPADFPMAKPSDTWTLCFALLEEFAIQLKRSKFTDGLSYSPVLEGYISYISSLNAAS